MHQLVERQGARVPPIVGEDRPERLIEVDAVSQKRTLQHAFLRRAELVERAVAAAVLECRTRLEPVHPDHIEREVEDERGGLHEQAAAPVLRAQREAPLGDVERRLKRPDLEQADNRVGVLERDPERERLSGFTLPLRPRDELLEPVKCRRRRRDQPRDFRRAERSQQRRRVRRAQFAKSDGGVQENWKTGAPVASRRHRCRRCGRRTRGGKQIEP